jgi:hypothetical protein
MHAPRRFIFAAFLLLGLGAALRPGVVRGEAGPLPAAKDSLLTGLIAESLAARPSR